MDRLLRQKSRSNIKFLGVFATLRKTIISSAMSACLSAWNNSAPNGRILMKLDISVFFEYLSRNITFH